MGTIISYCDICGEAFKPYRSFHKRCSDLCRRIATEKNNYGYEHKKIITKECIGCGEEFKTNNKKKVYHSPECQKESLEKRVIKKETQTRVCPVCKVKFETTHPTKKYHNTACYMIAKKEREHV